MQLGKIKKDYYKAFSQEEICTNEYKQDDNDEGVATWLVWHYRNLPESFKNNWTASKIVLFCSKDKLRLPNRSKSVAIGPKSCNLFNINCLCWS